MASTTLGLSLDQTLIPSLLKKFKSTQNGLSKSFTLGDVLVHIGVFMTNKLTKIIRSSVVISCVFANTSLAIQKDQPSKLIENAVIMALQNSNMAPYKTINHKPLAARRTRARSIIARATAYNSLASQTDSTPHITATGTRTRPGVIALSRDLLKVFPYGTRVHIQDLTGKYNFKNRVFIVEDTMNKRKRNSVDIWMYSYRSAIQFGARQVRVTAIR